MTYLFNVMENSIWFQDTVDLTGAVTVIPVGDANFYKTVSKMIKIEVTLPDNFFGNLQLSLKNTEYANDVMVEFCDIAVVETGDNFPCLNMFKDVAFKLGGVSKEING